MTDRGWLTLTGACCGMPNTGKYDKNTWLSAANILCLSHAPKKNIKLYRDFQSDTVENASDFFPVNIIKAHSTKWKYLNIFTSITSQSLDRFGILRIKMFSLGCLGVFRFTPTSLGRAVLTKYQRYNSWAWSRHGKSNWKYFRGLPTALPPNFIKASKYTQGLFEFCRWE